MSETELDGWGRDAKAVAAKLRVMADRIEEHSFGCLSLQSLGEIFGNEFWLLIAWDPVTMMPNVTRMADSLERIVVLMQDARR